jgi:hypothetical protein
VHVQPDPAIDTSVKPAGTVSLTVTTPLVGTAPAWFDSVNVYVAPIWPKVKLPVCVFVTARTGVVNVVCNTGNVTPAIVMLPFRGAPVLLGETEYCIVPEPAPGTGEVTVSHGESLTAFQPKPETAVCKLKLPAPPAAGHAALAGVMVTGAVIGDVAAVVLFNSVTAEL